MNQPNNAMRWTCALTLFAVASVASGDITPYVTKFVVSGPITGGEVAVARVDISANAPAGGQKVAILVYDAECVYLQLPGGSFLTIASGNKYATFQVFTRPVVNATTVTMSAGPPTPPVTTTVTVTPPKLALVSCDSPPNATPAKPLDCKAGLDGAAAANVTISLNTENTNVASVNSTATVKKGDTRAPFRVTAKPLAQSASTEVVATYAGVTKSTLVRVTPVALKDIQIQNGTTVVGGGTLYGKVELTAPAPAEGLRVKYKAQVTATHETNPPVPILLPAFTPISGGQSSAPVEFHTKGVRSQTDVTVTATTNFPEVADAATSIVTVLAAQISDLGFSSSELVAVPLGGTAIHFYLGFANPGVAPPGGAHVALTYSGETEITGPPELLVQEGKDMGTITTRVFPCSIQSQCKVYITATYGGSKKTAMLTVKH